MKNKTKNEIEQFVHQYCWTNSPGDETWSNNFYDCALGGYEISQKEFKKKLIDKLNQYKSNLQQEKHIKLTKTINQDKVRELEIRIETIKDLMK